MTLRFIYEQRFDKNQKEYWVKISVKTGKVVEKAKTFKKRLQSQQYRQKQVYLDKQFKEIAKTYSGDYHSIKARYKRQLAREIRDEKQRVKKERKKVKNLTVGKNKH